MGEKDLGKNVVDYKNVTMEHSKVVRERGKYRVFNMIKHGSKYTSDFDKLIRKEIKVGWTPIGALQKDAFYFVQTMVMYDTESNGLRLNRYSLKKERKKDAEERKNKKRYTYGKIRPQNSSK